VPDAAQADEGLRADARLVRDAIHALPEDQKHAVALVLVEGLSYAEAAQVLGVPAGTLTSRLVRGRQTLMQTLAEQGVTG
jgi:RNA polymerase sigma-70 factor (ECF subfamily)